MKPEVYAQALLQLVKKGDSPKEAVARVHKALEARGRGKLISSVGRAFERLAARDAAKNRNVLVVARAKDEHAARKASGASDADVVTDESLIGGWRLETGEALIDSSWKKYLLSLYNNATRA